MDKGLREVEVNVTHIYGFEIGDVSDQRRKTDAVMTPAVAIQTTTKYTNHTKRSVFFRVFRVFRGCRLIPLSDVCNGQSCEKRTLVENI